MAGTAARPTEAGTRPAPLVEHRHGGTAARPTDERPSPRLPQMLHRRNLTVFAKRDAAARVRRIFERFGRPDE